MLLGQLEYLVVDLINLRGVVIFVDHVRPRLGFHCGSLHAKVMSVK